MNNTYGTWKKPNNLRTETNKPWHKSNQQTSSSASKYADNLPQHLWKWQIHVHSLYIYVIFVYESEGSFQLFRVCKPT